VHHEGVYVWNEIDEEMANGVDKHAIVGSIGNMQVNEDAPVGSAEHTYDWADEESDDNNYDEVGNERGKENENAHGRNSDSNDYGEGGASGTAFGGNTNAASVGSGDGGPSNVP
jgi:hypothetical protein